MGHEHFVSDDRLEMKTFDTDENLVGWFIGKAQSELENAHVEGKCSEWCPYCVTEAEESLGEEKFWKWPVDGDIEEFLREWKASKNSDESNKGSGG